MREHARTGTEVFDGLRGAAIGLVVIYHTWLFSWYTPALTIAGIAVPVDVPARAGYLGVELFFVISGFVLFFPHAVRAVSGAGTVHDPAAFAIRRVAKIVPSYAIALAFTVASMASLHKPFAIVPTLATHLAFVNDATNDPLGYANSVFWSLAIEAQFYVIFPLLATVFRRHPLATACAMVAIALGYRLAVAPCCLEWEPIYRRLPAFLDVFAAGMLGAYVLVWLRAHAKDGRVARALATAVAFATLCAIWFFLTRANDATYARDGADRISLYGRTPFAFALAAFGVASALALRGWRRPIANPALRFLSLISYNLYLWHTLVMIWVLRAGALPHGTHNPYDDPHWKVAFIAVSWTATVAIATAITYFVERPILATISPQSFAFDFSALRRWSASAETRT